jgi:Flp pilus assembly protein TadG
MGWSMRSADYTPVREVQKTRPETLGRFLNDHGGASALEFAIVAAPLLLLLLGMLEVGLVNFANFELDNAVNYGARLVRTGQAQTDKFNAEKFKTEVCKKLTAPITCEGLRLDVRHFSNFTSADLTNPIDSSGNLKTSFSFDPGGPGQIVVVRAFYEWDLTAKMPKDIALSNMANGNRLLMSTAAFRNEPYAPGT